ncbi:MAG: TonB-dependent receptor domain-containing protein [Sumerlaeia bacterium]
MRRISTANTTLLLTSLVICQLPIAAQNFGSIRGFVIDADFEAPLPEASITIAETGDETRTSEDGNYVFGELEAGTYTLIFSKDGYTRQVTSQVLVTPGRLTETNASLSGEFTEMEEFVVQDIQFGGASELGLLELRFDSSSLLDSVGSELISKAGAGDAASALTLVSGATVEDGKFPVIRGLPDRYVNSQLNGLRLPTADAEKRAVALDQFPSSAIESIQVSKTFTPDQQGDASGGAVNIVLKGIPDEPNLKMSGSYSINSRTSGRDDFLTYEDGGLNFFGYDDGGRDTTRQTPGQSWTGAVGVGETEAPQDYKFNLSGGTKYELGNEVKIGGFASFFYERDSQHIADGVDDKYFVDKANGPLVPAYSQGSPSTDSFVGNLFDIRQSSQEVKWGSLGVLGVETENHKITLTGLFTHDAEDTVVLAEDTRSKEYYFPGYDPNDPDAEGNRQFQVAPYLRLETLRYRERETRTVQLQGEHTLPDPELEIDGFARILPPKIEWSVSEGVANLYEPDKRQFGSQWFAGRNSQSRPGRPVIFFDPVFTPLRPGENINLGNLNRSTREINERSTQYKGDITFPFTQWTDTEGFIKFGIYQDQTFRDYDQESFSNTGDGGAFFQGDFDEYWSNVWDERDVAINATEVDVDYRGEQRIDAWYWMVDVPLTNWFSVNGGMRYEETELSIVNTPESEVFWYPPGALAPVELNPGDADVFFDQQDQLPSIGFKFTPTEQWTLRGSYSETIARQTFRELTPIIQQEFLGGDIFIGNPELQTASLQNYDLRLDYAPYTGSLVSASYFVKQIQNPIENVQRAANAFTFVTPVNYPEGSLSGFEFEVRQELGRFFDPLEGIQVGANYTLIDSEVTLPEEELELFRQFGITDPPKTRDATNAPEFLYNLFLIYDMKKLGLEGTEVAVFYTVRGDTLVAGAGAADGRYIPDVYEREYGTLNASIAQELSPGWELKVAAKNILDPEIETVYRSEFTDGDVTRTSYQKGIEYSIGLSANF